MKHPSIRRIVQVLLVTVIVAFVLRESRILWGVEELNVFDLHVTDEVYTIQNMSAIMGGIVVLVLLTRRSSPKVRSDLPQHAPTEEHLESPNKETEASRKGRDKKSESPFELVNKKWKFVDLDKEEES